MERTAVMTRVHLAYLDIPRLQGSSVALKMVSPTGIVSR